MLISKLSSGGSTHGHDLLGGGWGFCLGELAFGHVITGNRVAGCGVGAETEMVVSGRGESKRKQASE